jgi:hypothetical protein
LDELEHWGRPFDEKTNLPIMGSFLRFGRKKRLFLSKRGQTLLASFRF